MDSFDTSKLSNREAEILDHATAGHTDLRIAQILGISASTVNSYWVRIRTKLGPMSRTELVASALRKSAHDEIKSLHLEALGHTNLGAETHPSPESGSNVPNFRFALDALPEAYLLLDAVGTITFSNRGLDRLFGYGADELLGRPIEDVVPLTHPLLNSAEAISSEPENLSFGIDKVLYGRHKDGRLLRIILLVGHGKAFGLPICSCIVRSFEVEVQDLKSHTAGFLRSIDLR